VIFGGARFLDSVTPRAHPTARRLRWLRRMRRAPAPRSPHRCECVTFDTNVCGGARHAWSTRRRAYFRARMDKGL